MVVLAPGRTIEAQDIPAELRGGRGHSLLPVPVVRLTGAGGEGRDLRPELEFVFRTLVDLRVDMDDLRREFEAYRRGGALGLGAGAYAGLPTREIPARFLGTTDSAGATDVEDTTFVEAPDGAAPASAPAAPAERGVVVFRPGMTMEDLEREAIRAVLDFMGGNRRKAAEALGIGERTLYRKLARYDMEQ